MILRKPYAILIKNFRFIHIALMILTGYLFYKTNPISNIFGLAVNNQSIYFGRDLILDYFSPLMYLAIILIILISITVMWLMVAKKKPYLFYLYNIIAYIFIFALLLISQYYFKEMSNKLVDVIILGNLRDFTLIAMLIQVISITLSFVRSTGFDIKKFNFAEDIEELNVSEEDREEIELQLDFNWDKFIAQIKRKIRYSKYFIAENRTLINIISLITVLVTAVYVYTMVAVFNHYFNEGDMVIVGDVNAIVNTSYSTSSSYLNDLVVKDNKLIIVKISLKSLKEVSLDLESVYLKIGDKTYNPVRSYDSYISDLGVSYKKEQLTSEYQDYLLVYRVSSNDEISTSKLILVDYILNDNKNISRQYKISLKPLDLDKDVSLKTYKINEEIEIKDNPSVNDCKFTFESINVKDYVEIPYKLCLNNNACNDSKEILRPSLDSYEKSILTVNAKGTCDINKLVTKFLMIEYKVNDKVLQTRMITAKEPIKAKKNGIYYFEVPEEVNNISKIKFTIRSASYEYEM